MLVVSRQSSSQAHTICDDKMKLNDTLFCAVPFLSSGWLVLRTKIRPAAGDESKTDAAPYVPPGGEV